MSDLKFKVTLAAEDGTVIQLENISYTIKFTKITDISGVEEQILLPVMEDWNYFFQFIRKCDWDESYEANSYDMLESRWSVDIAFKDVKLKSEGANSYPENFEEFLGALLSLLGLEGW